MESAPIPPGVQDVVALYTATKQLILKAEQLDPELCSNVAIIKEQRDALDHLMRVFGDIFAASPRGEKYRRENMNKVVGHLCRAGYDALDSLSIALKLRISKALADRSNDSIVSAFPDYYEKYAKQVHDIDRRVEESRGKKDIAAFSISNLHAYMEFLEQLELIAKEAEQRVPAMIEYDRRHGKARARERGYEWVFWIVFTILGAFAYWLAEKLLPLH